jgi:hypothetical protein
MVFSTSPPFSPQGGRHFLPREFCKSQFPSRFMCGGQPAPSPFTWLRGLAINQPRPIGGSRRESPEVSFGPYSYARSKDGCDDVIEIHGPDGFIRNLPFWEKEQEAREAANTVVEALNRFHAATRKHQRGT